MKNPVPDRSEKDSALVTRALYAAHNELANTARTSVYENHQHSHITTAIARPAPPALGSSRYIIYLYMASIYEMKDVFFCRNLNQLSFSMKTNAARHACCIRWKPCWRDGVRRAVPALHRWMSWSKPFFRQATADTTRQPTGQNPGLAPRINGCAPVGVDFRFTPTARREKLTSHRQRWKPRPCENKKPAITRSSGATRQCSQNARNDRA